MANIAVQLTIGDYDDWRPVFNKHKQMREEKVGINPNRFIATPTIQRKFCFGSRPLMLQGREK